MVQIINTIFIGLIVSQMLNNREKYKDRKKLKKTIIIAVWSVLYFLLFAFSDNFILIFGPGVFLVIYTYIDYGRKKRLQREQSSKQP
ncbi:hypothetical protein Back11_17690 [Paenibacillus baekrokdamisoli]|uniref:Uncharacterized protein n=1 Tax=Paenibacillus baekrokdamisoli TaxID=1712516 RepID=A0A3G9JAV7_9BACL|nr:hypothetical protein [Paenibacillus baekrokdamisoli]MBB3073490.1 hypothetical protein [Paenibacillus baekrokdamisoli]BBH20424.1 hypothetical protein Back11_17690 [Paenibacillus baekrokdamisoli]